MPQRIIYFLQSDTAEALGYTFTGVSITAVLAEYLGDLELNEVLKAIMFIGTILFMLFKSLFTMFKAHNSYLDSKGKRLDNKIKKHTLKKLEQDDSSK